jgi:hypothetical protein
VKFSKSGNSTIVTFGDDRKSIITVDEINRGFTTTFDNIDQSFYCGAGAQIPVKMIATSNNKCLVQF